MLNTNSLTTMMYHTTLIQAVEWINLIPFIIYLDLTRIRIQMQMATFWVQRTMSFRCAVVTDHRLRPWQYNTVVCAPKYHLHLSIPPPGLKAVDYEVTGPVLYSRHAYSLIKGPLETCWHFCESVCSCVKYTQQ